jgi:hypothetical protein
MSPILEHDEDYVLMRTRRRSKAHPPLHSLGIAVLVEIANSFETTVGDLLGERSTAYAARPGVLSAAVRILVMRFDLDVLDEERRRG